MAVGLREIGVTCRALRAGAAGARARRARLHRPRLDAHPLCRRRHGDDDADPLPRRALLTQPAPPDCDRASAGSELDERQRLDYQRQCYRHAELIARERLRALQLSVERTVKAVKENERGTR
jgi:hypothetical protein